MEDGWIGKEDRIERNEMVHNGGGVIQRYVSVDESKSIGDGKMGDGN